jgi:hypothetical protein
MASFDVFNGTPFSMVSLTTAVNKSPYRPGFLGSLNLFTPKPIRTTSAAIEQKDGVLGLIQTTPRGAPLAEGARDKSTILRVDTVRIAKGHTIASDEVQNVRAFGTESELQGVQSLVADRLNGPTGLIAQVEYTWENMRLGAVQGIVMDADGTSTLHNWYTLTGQSQPAETDFDLDNASPASGAVRKLCNATTRGVMRALGSLWLPGQSYLMALCGDAFWDDLTAHSEVRSTYLNTQEARDLRTGNAFESFQYGGITWVNYRGSDDNSTVAVNTDKVKFIPVNVPGLFEVAFAPSENINYANTPGMALYSMILMDDQRQFWVRPEVYSYPLFICTRPAALFRGKRT